MRQNIKIFLVLVSLAAAGLWQSNFGVMASDIKQTATPTNSPIPTVKPIKCEPKATEIIEGINRQKSDDSLENVLEKSQVGKWNGWNTVRKSVEVAVHKGVAANTIVLLLLLPLIATVVSVLHYVVGLSGYGIFMPTMISVTFLATGFAGGLVLFAIILMISLISNFGLRKLKLHFWPARSINLSFISIGTFGLMLASTYVPFLDISKISIFPVLLMILLSEEFVRTQLAKSKDEAVSLMVGTMVLSILGAGLMSIRMVQEWVLINPEIPIALGLISNFVVGNYTGIRWTEIKRFKKAIRKTVKK